MTKKIQKAIEVLESMLLCEMPDIYAKHCNACPRTEKCFSLKEKTEALNAAISALERADEAERMRTIFEDMKTWSMEKIATFISEIDQ